MSDSGTPDLTERQRELLSYLPASTPTLAERLGVEKTTVALSTWRALGGPSDAYLETTP